MGNCLVDCRHNNAELIRWKVARLFQIIFILLWSSKICIQILQFNYNFYWPIQLLPSSYYCLVTLGKAIEIVIGAIVLKQACFKFELAVLGWTE